MPRYNYRVKFELRTSFVARNKKEAEAYAAALFDFLHTATMDDSDRYKRPRPDFPEVASDILWFGKVGHQKFEEAP